MYMDGVVAYGLVIVALTCAVVGYVGYYMVRHIKDDIAKTDQEAE